MFTPFKVRSRFSGARRSTPPVNDTPVGFAVTEGDRNAEEWVTVSRVTAEQLITLGRTLELYYLPTIGLHGVSRLESGKVQRLETDLRIVLERTQDASVRDAVLLLSPLVGRIARDPQLSLLVAAGL